jgi:ABC-type nitrate/sulfonate/bicarbonate transport system permease component
MKARLGRIARPMAVAVVILAALQCAKWGGALPMTIPAPTEVAAALHADFAMLMANTAATLQAAAIGFTIALAASLLLMAAVAYVPAAESVVYNAALVLHTLPLLVLAPILVIWFGLGIEARVIISALAAYYPILIGGLHGLRASAGRATELMYLLSASRTQVLTKLTLPFAMPAFFAGLKVGATGAILGAVIAEWAGAETGLGVMMSYSLFSFQVARVWLTMFTMMLLAVAVYALVQRVERRMLRWTAPAQGAV